jgi:hypothetical protein
VRDSPKTNVKNKGGLCALIARHPNPLFLLESAP